MNNVFVGFVFGLLTVLAYQRVMQEPKLIHTTTITGKDVVEAYKTGKKDALRVNPVSLELEHACLNLWSLNHQEN